MFRIFSRFPSVVIGFLLCIVVTLINKTLKIKINNLSEIDFFTNNPFIFATWHKNTFTPFYFYRKKNIVMFVSDNFKGSILGNCAKSLGYDIIPTEKDPGKSMVKIIHKLREGQNVIMAVDGPNGPPLIIKEGSQYLTEKTGIPTIGLKVEYQRSFKLFWRWDKYEIPLPFSSVFLTFSEPFDKKADWKSLANYLG
ncbi:MAG: DUF374 domain-containing protein [Candidatus Margulisbacteria bacterium]|nr:DUF374 domain-containing protein [Candidatus Margulisiibacteriota bacterium]